MMEIIESAKNFPIYLIQDHVTGEWKTVTKNHLFGEEIKSLDELKKFSKDFCGI